MENKTRTQFIRIEVVLTPEQKDFDIDKAIQGNIKGFECESFHVWNGMDSTDWTDY